ncbi:MAG TPA: hypothetical protein VF624_19380, partial [Tepidisphaeraceae bacterium]
AWLTELKNEIGELPAARRARYVSALGMTPADAAALAGDKRTSDFFELILAEGVAARRAGVLMEAIREMSNERNRRLSDLAITPQHVAAVGKLIDSGKIAASKEVTKKILDAVLEQTPGVPAAVGGPASDPTASIESIAQQLGLVQTTDTTAIDAAIDAMLATNPKPLQDYKSGKASALGALTGMVMKSAKGMNAKLVQERLKKKLE